MRSERAHGIEEMVESGFDGKLFVDQRVDERLEEQQRESTTKVLFEKRLDEKVHRVARKKKCKLVFEVLNVIPEGVFQQLNETMV